MNTPLGGGFKIGLSLLGALAFLLGGCGTSDVMTYSRDAQRKGIAYYDEGNYGEAAGAFKNAARQNPRDYRSYYYLGASYEQMQQYQQATAAYKTARNTLNVSLAAKEDEEFRVKIINGLARSMARCAQSDAETNASVAEAESQKSGENWMIVAKIYAFRGDPDSAIDAYNRAALLEPKNFLILKDYGLYLDSLGQVQRAATPLRQAFTLRNNDEQVNQALRRSGVVPGPSIKPQSALVQPTLPKGPLPELEFKLNRTAKTSSAQAPPPTPQGSAEAPRD